MKKLYIKLVICCIPFLSLDAKDNTKRDTLIIEIEKEAVITIPLSDLSEIKNSSNIDSIVHIIGEDIKSLNLKPEAESYLLINLKKTGNKKEIIVDNKNINDAYIIDSSTVYHKKKMHTLNYSDNALTFFIDFVDLESLYTLSEMNINRSIKEIDKQIEEDGGYCRYARTYKFDFNTDTNTPVNLVRNYSKMYDMLELNIATGASLIRNQLVPDLGFKVSFSFSKKEILKNSYDIKANLLYYFNETNAGFKTYINTLISLGYRHNFTDSKEFSNWIGIDAGYIINKNGNYFQNNTFVLGANWELQEFGMFNISIAPQFYFNDNFKDIFPGIRLGVGF